MLVIISYVVGVLVGVLLMIIHRSWVRVKVRLLNLPAEFEKLRKQLHG